MYNQFAKVALELIGSTSIKATDADLLIVLQTRKMLSDIANGQLVVGAPITDPPTGDAPVANKKLRAVVDKAYDARAAE